MKILAYLLIAIGATTALLGLVTSFIPFVGITLMAVGGFTVWCGQLLKRKARQMDVDRLLGG